MSDVGWASRVVTGSVVLLVPPVLVDALLVSEEVTGIAVLRVAMLNVVLLVVAEEGRIVPWVVVGC